MLHEYIYIYSDWVLLSSFSYAYHMRLLVQQTAILLELNDVNSSYRERVPDQSFILFPRG